MKKESLEFCIKELENEINRHCFTEKCPYVKAIYQAYFIYQEEHKRKTREYFSKLKPIHLNT